MNNLSKNFILMSLLLSQAFIPLACAEQISIVPPVTAKPQATATEDETSPEQPEAAVEESAMIENSPLLDTAEQPQPFQVELLKPQEAIPLSIARPTTPLAVKLDFIDQQKLQQKPYIIAQDLLRLVCVKIRKDADLLKQTEEMYKGLSKYNCDLILKDQSALLTKDPKFYFDAIVNDLAFNLSTFDYNIALMEIQRIFEQAATELLAIQPQLIWSTVDDLMAAVHEKNWKTTTEIRLDGVSRVGTAAKWAGNTAMITAAGIFVLRMGTGFWQGLSGTRYFSSTTRGFSRRAGEHTKYLWKTVVRKRAWEKPVFERVNFEHNSVKQDWYVKASAGNPTVNIKRVVQRTSEVKTLAQLESDIARSQSIIKNNRTQLEALKGATSTADKEALQFANDSIKYHESQILHFKTARRVISQGKSTAVRDVGGTEFRYTINGSGENATVTISHAGASAKPENTISETIFETKTLAEVRDVIKDLNYKKFNDEMSVSSLETEMNHAGADVTNIKGQLSKLAKNIKELEEKIAVYQGALASESGILPEHLRILAWRKEVLGAKESELATFAKEQNLSLTAKDWEFLKTIKSRSFFDRLLGGPDQKLGQRIARESMFFFVSAGLGAYAGSWYQGKLMAKDLKWNRPSALMNLGESYVSALTNIESNLERDLSASNELLETLKTASETHNLALIKELANQEELADEASALQYWIGESGAVLDSETSVKASIKWLTEHYKAPNKEKEANTKDTLAGIDFNPERVLAIHNSIIRNQYQITKLCFDLTKELK